MYFLGKVSGHFSLLFSCLFFFHSRNQKTEDPIELDSVTYWLPNPWKTYICPSGLDPVPLSICLCKSCLPFLSASLDPNPPVWICKPDKWAIYTTHPPGNIIQNSSWADCRPHPPLLTVNIIHHCQQEQGGTPNKPWRMGSRWKCNLPELAHGRSLS
jgi:hypothetical protein